jgi:hypothetical protein
LTIPAASKIRGEYRAVQHRLCVGFAPHESLIR